MQRAHYNVVSTDVIDGDHMETRSKHDGRHRHAETSLNDTAAVSSSPSCKLSLFQPCLAMTGECSACADCFAEQIIETNSVPVVGKICRLIGIRRRTQA